MNMEIVERDVSSACAKPPAVSTPRGFPEVLVCDVKNEGNSESGSGTSKKRKSLFARQTEKHRHVSTSKPVVDVRSAGTAFGGASVMVDGSGLGSAQQAASIHEQNAAVVAAMSEGERLAAQRELAASLDAKLLEFVRGRRAVPAPASEPEQPMDESTAPPPGEAARPPAVDSAAAPDAAADASMAELEKVKEQLPIDLDEARRWPHMDRIEPEKLLWMTQLPAPQVADGQTGFAARFDFEGTLLPFAAAPPVQSALYHHGEEPERAGYSVDDMFRLTRSAVQQQRVLGLQMLANLLRQAKSGQFDGVLDPPLLGRLLDAGLLLLLRFAVDDDAEPVMTAGLVALEALLDNRPDEVCMDRVLGWSRGLEQPSLPTAVDTEPETARQYRAEEAGLKDDTVTRMDAVRALVRTDTLARIRYLLEVVRPPPPAVLSAVRLLTRCGRHSLQLAVEVAACPRLVDTLVSCFLPVCGAAPLEGCADSSQLSSVYGVPLHPVVKLLRVLASQSAQLAGRLVRRHRLMEALLSYVAINPSDSGLPTQEVLTLAIESYRLWTVLLSYGLGDSQFIEFFPLVVRQLHYYLAAVAVDRAQEANKYNHDLGSWLLALCRAAVCAAWSNHQTELLNRTGVDLTAPGALRWGHVAGLLEPVEQCTRKWLSEAARSSDLTDNALQLLGSCLQFLTAFHERWSRMGLDDTVPRLRSVQLLCDVTLVPFVTSQTCQLHLAKLRRFSSLLSGFESGRRRDPASLPSAAAVCWGGGRVSPTVAAGSPLPLLTDLLQLARALCRLHRGVGDGLCAPLLGAPSLAEYLAALAGPGELSLVGDWFTRHELHLATELLLLHVQQGSSNPLACHAAALRLLHCYQSGDEHLCAEVMRHVVFNAGLLSDVTPSGGGGREPAAALSQLVSSCSLYERSLLRPAAAAATRDRADSLSGRVAALAAADAGRPLLPRDWWYGPLLQLYERHNPAESEKPAPAPPSSLHGVEPAQVVTRCLNLLHLLFVHHRHVVDAVSVTSHFARICCVFLAGDDLFLDPDVQRSLRLVLGHVLSDPGRLDLTAEVPGLASFSDLFVQLLDQFEGVSYGDPLFGAVLLLALEPRQPAELRRLVWLERTHVLRSVTTRPEQMLVPLERFVAAPETDESVRKAYRRALASGLVTAARNPALFQIASALSAAA